jgi:predicted amidohydrolase
MKVAIVQFASEPDATANRARVSDLARAAAGTGAELVVFPEASMYPLNRPPAEMAEAAETLDGPFVEALRKGASELGVTVIAGMFERVSGQSRVHNTVVAIGANGLLGRYRKLHLYDALGYRESTTFEPGHIDGDELLTVRLADFVFGVATCYDLRFPELWRALSDCGVNAFVLPAAQRTPVGHYVPRPGDREHLLRHSSGPASPRLHGPEPRARPDGSRARPPR